MDLTVIKSVAQVAAPAGLALIVFLFVARDVIAKKIFPTLTKERAYHVIVIIAGLAALIALVALICWTYVTVSLASNDKSLHTTTTPTQAENSESSQVPNSSEFWHPIGLRLPFQFSEAATKGTRCEGRRHESYLAPRPIEFNLSERSQASDISHFELQPNNEGKLAVEAAFQWVLRHQTKLCSVYTIGSTGEKTSREHALAIGQARAENVKQMLAEKGINPEFIEAISFGREAASSLFTTARGSKSERIRSDFVEIAVAVSEQD